LYYNIENSRIYHEKELKYLEVENDTIPSIQLLINSYPKYVQIQSLPMSEIDEKISVASFLYEKGLLVTKGKLEYAFERGERDDE
jgi:lysine-specific demethylase/histidyl-hydroxylase NO66